MAWNQLKIETSAEQAESLSEQLEQLGAVSVCMQANDRQALFAHDPESSTLWNNTQVVGLFEASIDIQSVVATLRQTNASRSALQLQVSQLQDQDWERAWMDRFHPMQFGPDLWICPSWLEPPQPDAVNIVLDPGMAFGTGTHPTTAMCMEWLANNRHVDLSSVIDYGCGSGILALAAAKLGAERVWGIDIEEQALIASRENARINGVSEQLKTALPDQTVLPAATLLLANILAGPLASLASRFADLVLPAQHIVLSGILVEQAQQTIDAYTPWFEMDLPVQREEWVMLHGIRREAEQC